MIHEYEVRDTPERPLAERVADVRSGVLTEAATVELLRDTAWTHQRRHTTSGTAHVFTRPITFLESLRINGDEHPNRRQAVGVTQPNGERLLTLAVLRNVHTEDLQALPRLERRLEGEGRVRLEDFPPFVRPVMELPWMEFDAIAEHLGLSEKTTRTYSDRARARVGVDTRGKFTVMGLQQGFLDLPVERWQGNWPELSAARREVLPYMHLNSPEIAEKIGTTMGAIHARMVEIYRLTGVRNRSELVLAALANGAVKLRDLDVEMPGPELTEPEKSVLAIIDEPAVTIAGNLGMSRKTVDDYIASVRHKFGLNDRMQVAMLAFREGYVSAGEDPALGDVFTEKHLEIAPYIGYSNEKIMELTELSVGVVNHRAAQMRKNAATRDPRITDRVGLAVYVARAGLLDPDEYLP